MAAQFVRGGEWPCISSKTCILNVLRIRVILWLKGIRRLALPSKALNLGSVKAGRGTKGSALARIELEALAVADGTVFE